MLSIFAIFAIQASAAPVPLMNVPPYNAPAVARYWNTPAQVQPMVRGPMGASTMQQFGPYLGQAPPVQYTPVYSATPQSPGLKKLVRPKGAVKVLPKYDKESGRIPGADSYVKDEKGETTYGRYGVEGRENPERGLEGPRYGSGLGPKKNPIRRSTSGVNLEELDEETSGDMLSSVIALLMGMVVGSTVTYVVAKPRMISKKIGSPEPLLAAV